MAEPPDIESLARRFLDLWQEQLTAMADNPEFAASADRILAALNPGVKEKGAGDETATSGGTAGTAAAGNALGDRGDELRRLECRLAALEERLATLEAGVAGDSGGARKGGGAGGS